MLLHMALLFQTVVGAAYQFPAAVTVAPGQVIPILVTGLKTVLPLPAVVQAQSVPLPASLAGISLTLQQTAPDRSWQLPLFAIEQVNQCGGSNASAACLVTAIMVQIPFDIAVPNPLLFAVPPQGISTLTIMENGAPSQTFQVNPVFDRVHVVQSCDIGGATAGGGICYPLVTHADGSLVLQDARAGGVAQTHSEARPGETLVMYAFGLGEVSTPVAPGVPSPVPPAVAAETVSLGFDYSPNAGPSMPAAGVLEQPVFAGLTPGQIGLYQINFVVPPPPAGTAPCGWPVESNLTVNVLAAGSGSFDGAAICVDPGAAAP